MKKPQTARVIKDPSGHIITFNIAFLSVDCKNILDELKKKK